MKYTFGEFKEYFANRRGFATFADMKTELQRSSMKDINTLLERVWYHKQWGFSGKTKQLTLVPAVSNTASGTAGEAVVTLGTAISTSYEGVPVAGQLLQVGSRSYVIRYVRSTTVVVLDTPLAETLSSTAVQIVFPYYCLPYDVGSIRFINRGNDDLLFLPEQMTATDHATGEPDFAFNAGQNTEDFLSSGSVSLTNGSREALYSSTVSVQHIGMAIQLKVSNNYQWYTVVDAQTTGNKWILDRSFTGTSGSGISYALNPRGIQRIGFKSFPITREVVEVAYTKAPNKLVNDADQTELPDDSPMIAGIEALATLWESVGEGNINDAIFKDKKFLNSLKTLNFRGVSLQNKLYTQEEVMRLRRFPRNSNPWNRW